jgi:hypothetical protein
VGLGLGSEASGATEEEQARLDQDEEFGRARRELLGLHRQLEEHRQEMCRLLKLPGEKGGDKGGKVGGKGKVGGAPWPEVQFVQLGMQHDRFLLQLPKRIFPPESAKLPSDWVIHTYKNMMILYSAGYICDLLNVLLLLLSFLCCTDCEEVYQ